MATLQKIRNRGGLLVSIVIGLALIAFIVGDALSSGASVFNRSRNQVGEIAGEEVSIQEYQRLLSKNEELIKMMGDASALTSEQHDQLRESTWQQLIMERVMGTEFEKLGIAVSNDELYDMLLGDNMDPNVRRLFADPTTGEVDLNQARTVIKQLISAPANSPQKAYWLNMEKEIADAREMSKYNNLLAKAMFVTDAQIEDNLAGNAQVNDINYVVRNYSTISDSAVQVSNSEIEKYYNANKKRFEQNANRQITYVSFDIVPSTDDYNETEKQVAGLADEFADATDVAEFIGLTSDTKFDGTYFKKEDISNEALADFVFSNDKGVYGPYLESEAYKIARRGESRMLPDSVRARHILLPLGTNADSLVNLIKKGADFEAIAKTNSTDQNSAINGGDLGWFSQSMMVQPFSDSAFFANKGELKIVNTQFGTHILQVTDRSKPVEKVQIAVIAKEVYPSTETTNKIYNDARSFAQGVKTIEQFNNRAAEMNVTKRMATLAGNDRAVAGIEGSRDIVRQAYLNDQIGQVLTTGEQTIFENGDKYTIAVLTGITPEGISPLKQVSGQIRSILVRQKKAEMLAKEFDAAKQGSQSLLSLASKMNSDVREAADITFNSFQIPGAGIEPNVIGSITTLKEGEFSQPIEGNQGVYVFQVTSRKAEENTSDMKENVKQRMTQMNAYSAAYQAMQALNKNGNIVDQRYKFY